MDSQLEKVSLEGYKQTFKKWDWKKKKKIDAGSPKHFLSFIPCQT